MKIAIVAPSPVPFTVGGAEKLWWGMLEYINKHTKHQCELIKVPTKEGNFWDLIDSYHTFYKLDLSYFDMVITGKYPAWMLQHENHHIYMLHCLRGLYDCYHFLNLDENVHTNHPKITAFMEQLKEENKTIETVFQELYALKEDVDIDPDFFTFPSAFAKEIIHFFDQKAMQNVRSFSAISKTVAQREVYFPKNTQVNVIYPPSSLQHFTNQGYEYFFTLSRLDSAKRIEMIVKAYKNTKTSIPLKIAGTGPLSKQIEELAQDDPRIELLGFISDDEVIAYYAKAYAVIFIPYDEDYGLITIEAMMSQKPLVTFSDTGGVVEFVEDQITGLVSEPSVEKLTQNIDFLADNPQLCKEMGKNAQKRVESITWKHTIDSLLQLTTNNVQKKITVVTTYPIYPPRGGGQNRIFYLYKELAKSIKVEIVSLAHETKAFEKKEIAPNLFEICVPKSKEHAQKEWEMEKEAALPITDIAMLSLYPLTPLFQKTIEDSFQDAAFLIATQPYTYALCKRVSKTVIHDSQNVEYKLKKQMLKKSAYNAQLLQQLFEAEKEATLDALFTTVCAYDDAKVMQKLYGFDISKAVLVPNGVDLQSVPFVPLQKRKSIKSSLDIGDHKIALFIGSWHQPNIDAVEEIFHMAKKLSDYSFIIMGSVGEYFKDKAKPHNVGFAGITSDEEKELYLSIADVAINPMLSGSGTNLKMLDYMANGIPVVSTEVGARGLNIPKGLVAICEIEEFSEHIKNIQNYVDIQKSREYVEKNFAWSVIQKNLKEALLNAELRF